VLPEGAADNSGLFSVFSEKSNPLQVLESIFANIQTKYILTYPNGWITTGGTGILDAAADVLNYAEKQSIKISQVTQLFYLWGEYRYLGEMRMTDHGVKFHEIATFKPSFRYYFTFKPSVINFDVLYETVLKKNIREFSVENRCEVYSWDCVEKAIGDVLYEKNRYFQVIVNDGDLKPNVFESKK
jgi:hypothetical protein